MNQSLDSVANGDVEANVLRPSEEELRDKISSRILDNPGSHYPNIEDFIRKIGIEGRGQEVYEVIRNAVVQAEQSDQWGVNCNKGIEMGYFLGAGDFYATFFHEVGHILFTGAALGENEEEICWKFSECVCNELGLEYSTEIAANSMRFIALRNEMDEIIPEFGLKEWQRRWSDAQEEENKILGIEKSFEEERRGVIWRNGRPFLTQGSDPLLE